MRRQEVHRRVADEAAAEHRGRVLIDSHWRVVLDDLATMHDGDPIGEAHGLDLVVGDVDRGGPALLQDAL
jgi:hypothetical protein